MDNKQRQEVTELVHIELNKRGYMTKDELQFIVDESITKTLHTTLRLMGVRFKDNGDIDFDHAHDNNEYVTRLRRGHKQVVGIIFNSCLATAVIAFMTILGTSIYEHFVSVVQKVSGR